MAGIKKTAGNKTGFQKNFMIKLVSKEPGGGGVGWGLGITNKHTPPPKKNLEVESKGTKMYMSIRE